jgi:hypothetical protein
VLKEVPSFIGTEAYGSAAGSGEVCFLGSLGSISVWEKEMGIRESEGKTLEAQLKGDANGPWIVLLGHVRGSSISSTLCISYTVGK